MRLRLLSLMAIVTTLVMGCSDAPERAEAYGVLASASAAVVVAEATGEAEGFPVEKPPRSLWTLRVISVLKGDPGGLIRVELVGDPVEKRNAFLEGYPPFQGGQRYVLFLQRKGEVWTIVPPGYLEVDADSVRRIPASEDLPRNVSLSDLKNVISGA